MGAPSVASLSERGGLPHRLSVKCSLVRPAPHQSASLTDTVFDDSAQALAGAPTEARGARAAAGLFLAVQSSSSCLGTHRSWL